MAPRRRDPFPSSSSCSSVVTEERGEEEVWKPSTAKKDLKKRTRAKKGAPMTVAALHAAAAATRIPWTKAETGEMLSAAEVLVSEKLSEMAKVMRDIKMLREILDLLREGMR